MDTAISTILMLPDTVEQAEKFKLMLINDITESGYHNVLKMIKILRLNAGILDEVVKSDLVMSAARRELGKYDKEKAEEYGCKFSIVGRKTYKFETCNDSKYNELKESEVLISEKRKQRENFLKSLTEPVADPDTGEIINVPYFENSESLKVEHLKTK
jgi:hypothetical protein